MVLQQEERQPVSLRKEFSLLSNQGNCGVIPFLLQNSRDLALLISIDENVEQLGSWPALLEMPIGLRKQFVPKGAVSILGSEPWKNSACVYQESYARILKAAWLPIAKTWEQSRYPSVNSVWYHHTVERNTINIQQHTRSDN